ncbi:MAG: 4-(cytidine 5'-diphospho)-2-C-methyl-D-erythritol kinase, partial [Dehalococcoidia bacterium]|nr:4-(cytidine 5'-diphospho)-2-C-methyl-D-erythritol kinase [Dehalococcoidia bacterium]
EPAQDLLFQCDQPDLSGPDNLVLQAARLLKDATGYQGGARIHLAKRIPAAAGLGGGSSDAAAALQGLNQLWKLDLTRERLLEMASRLGSDVPFFLYGGTAEVEGRGNKVTPLPAPDKIWLVLLRPPLTLPEKTRRLYGSLNPRHFTGGEHTQALAEALLKGRALTEEMLFNVFEGVAPALFPSLEEYRSRLRGVGARKVHLAGSGPAIFALFDKRDVAEETLAGLSDLEVHLAHTIAAAK